MAFDKTNFVIYQEEFYGGMWEGLTRVTDGFNAASAGTIRLIQAERKGDFEKESFFQDITGLIAHRDPTDVQDATPVGMTQEEKIGVKVPRRIGPVEQTLDSWRRIAKDEREMSFILGKIMAGHKAKDLIDTTLLALVAGIKQRSTAAQYDATGQSTKTLTHTYMTRGMAKLGDASDQFLCWVSHSKPFFDVMEQSITDKVFEVAGVTIYRGTVASFNRPWLVIDSPSVLNPESSAVSNDVNTYEVLGLTAGAATCNLSEEQEIVAEKVSGKNNLIFRVQGEYAFNLSVKGAKWDIAAGGDDPVDAALGTSTNWDAVLSSVKQGPGFRITVQ